MKRLLLTILAAGVIVGGCGKAEKTKKESEPDQAVKDDATEETEVKDAWWEKEPEFYESTDLPREMTEDEKNLMRKPGEFSGEQYDEQAAIEKLKELPNHLTSEQYTEAILKLVAEDYHKEVQELIKFDPTIEVTGTRPDEDIDEPIVNGVHYAILLDASGSMNAQNKGGTRMDEAKSAIMSFIDVLPKESTVSLRVYGYEGTGSDADKERSCASTETLYHGANDSGKVKSALEQVKPAGWTPIGKAIAETKKDIPEDAGSAIVYVVSDGIETCGGDPVKEAKQLAAEGIKPIINIIGFQVDNEAQQLLKEVAEAGNGEFTLANSKQDVEKYWQEEYQRLMDAWGKWQREGLKEVGAKQKELMKKADDLGQTIMKKSDIEFKHAEDLQSVLSREGIQEEYDITNKVWNLLYERQKKNWGYGYETGTKTWREAYEDGNKVWREIYYEGNNKWQEYYHKQ
ncbi:VWA domain-containing protein [Bacillus norwichensis]|uniref:VWA domain-containing protein n=1 Tax=Bacillus norwichensis TaxID=2762217 RepID=A0ABR8VLG0_9BACI|nr:VWA domain-containing protein [Bacillus norwichensis]MBD8005610.1 VWA domain-containing protein [Bacillus norwichensis]